ncbi:MAG: hypothetical protein DHS20C18_15910 [Saprospiraceae bacterium]|nr:MAG: hypothetical protein DHS20C18_15910 [Saprospiraceae bacterium]
MEIYFNAISEPTQPGPKWQNLFNRYWPAYRAWFVSKNVAYSPDLKTSLAALKQFMPEMLPTYDRLCELANADQVAARFLTGYQPPAFINACSQAVMTKKVVQLVRNYDYHPELSESTQLLSSWNGRKVIANNDCLSGVLDGMNDDGLAISLTFGGRKVVGKGFGIPFILRYVLEFCTTVEEAIEALTRVPSHMSYNVTVLDRSGAYKTVQLAPDRPPQVTDAVLATNHQGKVDWPENAQFNKTVERAEFLKQLLLNKEPDAATMLDAFLQPPLYNTRFKEGFGTLYTAVYRPQEGSVQLHWPEDHCKQSFDHFQEVDKLIKFKPQVTDSLYPQDTNLTNLPTEAGQGLEKDKLKPENTQPDWQHHVVETIVDSMGNTKTGKAKKLLATLKEGIKRRGQIPWEVLVDFWSDVGEKYRQKWRKDK